jgi:hypothetical protein
MIQFAKPIRRVFAAGHLIPQRSRVKLAALAASLRNEATVHQIRHDANRAQVCLSEAERIEYDLTNAVCVFDLLNGSYGSEVTR